MTTSNTCVYKNPTNSTLDNCLVAVQVNATYMCSECAEEYVNLNNSCISPSITGCATYLRSLSTEVTCTSCNDSFYLSDNKCEKGNVVNCKTYNQQGLCTQCL